MQEKITLVVNLSTAFGSREPFPSWSELPSTDETSLSRYDKQFGENYKVVTSVMNLVSENDKAALLVDRLKSSTHIEGIEEHAPIQIYEFLSEAFKRKTSQSHETELEDFQRDVTNTVEKLKQAGANFESNYLSSNCDYNNFLTFCFYYKTYRVIQSRRAESMPCFSKLSDYMRTKIKPTLLDVKIPANVNEEVIEGIIDEVLQNIIGDLVDFELVGKLLVANPSYRVILTASPDYLACIYAIRALKNEMSIKLEENLEIAFIPEEDRMKVFNITGITDLARKNVSGPIFFIDDMQVIPNSGQNKEFSQIRLTDHQSNRTELLEVLLAAFIDIKQKFPHLTSETDHGPLFAGADLGFCNAIISALDASFKLPFEALIRPRARAANGVEQVAAAAIKEKTTASNRTP
jgi:hypothetical protein